MYFLPETSRSKKRQGYTFESSPEVSAPPAKRRKSTPEAEAHCAHRPPRFWNTLSKVRLSRGAIREFERRTSQTGRQKQLPFSPGVASSTDNIQQRKRFSRHGGPDLAHLRGFASMPGPNDPRSFSSSQSRKRSSTSGRTDAINTTRSSPYNGDFEQKLIDTHIYPAHYEYSNNKPSVKPANLDDIQRRLRVPRSSLSPSQFSEGAFEKFQRQTAKAANEASAMADVIPIIAGEGRKKFHSVTDAQFTNISPVVEDVTAPKPDVYDGVRPERIDSRVRHSLGGHIVPSKNTSCPAVPNFFLEGKASGGRADVAQRQGCYDGAVGARAMHSLQNYSTNQPQYDGNAYSYPSTFHNGTGTLQLYATHPTQPQSPGGQSEYHMTQIKSYAMTSDRETFQTGATAFRNLRDLAGLHRDSFIEEANRAARHAPILSPSTTLTESRSILNEDRSDTSADDLAAEKPTTKRYRHGSGATQSAGISPSNVVPKSSSRSTMPPGAPSRYTIAGDAEEPKRRRGPSQKLRDSEWDVAGNKGEPRRRRQDNNLRSGSGSGSGRYLQASSTKGSTAKSLAGRLT